MSDEPRWKTYVRVQVTVEIVLGGSLHANLSLAEHRKNAVEGAEQALRRGLIIDGLQSAMAGINPTPAKVVGRHKVVVVDVVEDETT